MRNLFLAVAAVALAACATPTMTASNAPANPQAAAGPNQDEQPPTPPLLRRPQRTLEGWGAVGSGSSY